MNIGGLDRRITIQESTLTSNEYGEKVPVWSTYATVWAQITRKPTASERLSSEQMISFNNVEFIIRNASNVSEVSPGHRILYNGKPHNILGVHELGRSEGFRIITERLDK